LPEILKKPTTDDIEKHLEKLNSFSSTLSYIQHLIKDKPPRWQIRMTEATNRAKKLAEG